jgi:hypothetical protein
VQFLDGLLRRLSEKSAFRLGPDDHVLFPAVYQLAIHTQLRTVLAAKT